jgi:hypothetical protein
MGRVHFRDSGSTNDMPLGVFDDLGAEFPRDFNGMNS